MSTMAASKSFGVLKLFESAMMTVNYNGKTDVKIGFDRKDKTGKMFIILFRI